MFLIYNLLDCVSGDDLLFLDAFENNSKSAGFEFCSQSPISCGHAWITDNNKNNILEIIILIRY